jgi:hypothetical protein
MDLSTAPHVSLAAPQSNRLAFVIVVKMTSATSESGDERMAMAFHVLASGSGGNASLLQVDGTGVLLDFGLGPRVLGQRLRACGAGWGQVQAALLTHTHGDHWQAPTLGELLRRRIPLHCHAEHLEALARAGDTFAAMKEAGLIQCYELGRAWELPPGCRCQAIELNHDGGMTCGFRFDGPARIFGPSWALGYAADLGCWDEGLAERFRDVDVLALEFNHDVELQRRSGRSYALIRRVLGDSGHLSNAQAADLLRAVIAQSETGRLRHVVQLHLSQQCNRPELAQAATRRVSAETPGVFAVHTASQDQAGPTLRLQAVVPRRRLVRAPGSVGPRERQLVLPGWEGDREPRTQ